MTSKAVYSALLISCWWEHCQCRIKLTLPKEIKAEAFWFFSTAQESWCCCRLQAKWQMSWKWVSFWVLQDLPFAMFAFLFICKADWNFKERSPHLKEHVFVLIHPLFFRKHSLQLRMLQPTKLNHVAGTPAAITTSVHYYSNFLYQFLKIQITYLFYWGALIASVSKHIVEAFWINSLIF